MLLSFPIDASQDTIDLIQEQAYANSTIIDGRRFAADFIARRKIDVQPQTQGNDAVRLTSLADGGCSFFPVQNKLRCLQLSKLRRSLNHRTGDTKWSRKRA